MAYCSNLSKEFMDFKAKYKDREHLYLVAYGELIVIITRYIKLVTGKDIDITKKNQNVYLESLLYEFDYCAYIKLTGNTIMYKKDNYGKIELLYGYINSVTNTLGDIIAKMVEEQIPLPVSFIKRYNDLYLPRYLEMNYENILKEYTYKYHIDYETLDNSQVALMENFIELIKTSNLRAEDIFKTAIKADEVYRVLTKNGALSTSIFDNLVLKMYKCTFCVNGTNGERLATKKERKKMYAGVYKKKESILGEEKDKYILVGCWVFTGNDKYYAKAKLEKYNTIADKLLNNIDLINSALEYLETDTFLNDCKTVQSIVEPEYLDSAEDELEDIKLVNMIKEVKKVCDPEDSNYFKRMAWDIASKVLKDKEHNISEKQYNIIVRIYNQEIKKEKVEDQSTKENKYNTDLIDKMHILRQRLGNSKHENFVKDIMKSVTKYKRCSEKQYNIIIEEYNNICAVDELLDSGVETIDLKGNEIFKETSGDEEMEIDFGIELNINEHRSSSPFGNIGTVIDVNKMFSNKEKR